MMEFKIKNRKRSLVSFISMVMVVMLCFALTVQATTEAPKQPEGGFANNDTQQETEELETTEIDGEKELEEPVAVVTVEDMAAAWDALLVKLDAAQAETHGQAIAAAKENADLVRQDLLEAIQACAEAVGNANALTAQADAVIFAVEASEDLTEEQKDLFLQEIEDQLFVLAGSPLDLLMTDLMELQADPAAKLHTEQLKEEDTQRKELTEQLAALETLLEKLPQLPGVEERIAQLNQQFADAGSKTGAGEAELAGQIAAFGQRGEEIRKNIDGFFDLTAEDQQILAQSIDQLEEEVDAFSANAVIHAVRRSDALEQELKTVSEEAAKVQNLQLLLYVALGIGALSLIMGVIAAIMAVAKSRDKDIDLSVYATREDAEALSRQNASLKQQRELQEQKLERIRLELEHLAQERREAKPEPKPKAEPVAAPAAPVVAPVAKPSLGSEEEVCRLNMVYQHMNPRASYLEVAPNGAYILYADNTVALSAEKMAVANSFKGWTNNGLLLMFDTKVDGKVLDAERDVMPSGYYAVAETLRRATVSALEANRYTIHYRGVVSMSNQ